MKAGTNGGEGPPNSTDSLADQPAEATSPGTPGKETKEMENMGIDPNLLLAKMNDGDKDDKTLWLFLLLILFGGRRGFGLGGGEGGGDGGVRSHSTLEDINALTRFNADQFGDLQRDLQAIQGTVNVGNKDIIAAIAQAALQVQNGQCDIRQAVSDCCCTLGMSLKDVENAICKCCCELGIGQKDILNAVERTACDTQNLICTESNTTRTAVHAEGEATRALLNTHRMEDLQNQLAICRDELSNEKQTAQLERVIREQCDGGHHRGGGRGYEVATTGKK